MSAIDRRGRAAGKGGVSPLSLRRIDADAARASRVRRGDAPAIDGRESRLESDATFGLPRSRRPTRVQGKREVRCARSGAFGDARARSSVPKRGGTWDRDASKRLCRRTSPRRRVGVGVSAARVVRLCTVTRHPRFFSVHLRLSCAVAGDRHCVSTFGKSRLVTRSRKKLIRLSSQSE